MEDALYAATPCSSIRDASTMAASVRQSRRGVALKRVVDYLLEHGLGNASLRTLATAVGTSDRMLLYYFSDKEELMLEAFACIVQRQSELLATILPVGRQPFEVLLAQMWQILKAPEYEPYMRIWYDALGRASQGEETYRTMASRVIDVWFKWFEPRSSAPPARRKDEIAAVVAAACGLVMLRYVGRAKEAEGAATALSRSTETSPHRLAVATKSSNRTRPVTAGSRRQ